MEQTKLREVYNFFLRAKAAKNHAYARPRKNPTFFINMYGKGIGIR